MIIVYDISVEESFRKVPGWLNDVERFATDCKIRMLIGNKADQEEHRMITGDEAEIFAKCNSLNEFIETSAKVVEVLIYCSIEGCFIANCLRKLVLGL